MTYSASVFMFTKTRLFACLFIFLLAAAWRLPFPSQSPLYTDERLWLERSAEFVRRLDGPWQSLTSHFTHPGVPAGVAMGVAQKLALKWNAKFDFHEAQAGYLSPAAASRLTIGILGSLVPVVFFISTYMFCGMGVAVIAASFLALDPMHIACSRMAHVDVVLGLFVLLSATSYLAGLRTGKLFWGLIAGVFFGCAVATKPTAVFLLPALFFFRILCAKYPEWMQRKVAAFSWSDVWALIVSQIVFALMYTRLWFHRSDYKVRLGIQSSAADWLFSWGRYFRKDALGWSFLTIVLCVGMIAILLLRKRFPKACTHFLLLLGTASVVFSLWILFPPVYENLARFWTWTFGLSDVSQASFLSHRAITEFRYGYAELIFRYFPDWAFALCLIGLVATVFLKRSCAKDFFAYALFFILVGSSSFIFLEIADKQNYRYFLPILPSLYLFVAIALVSIEYTTRKKRALFALVGCLGIFACIELFQISPYFLFYRSRLSGGLKEYLALEYPLENFSSKQSVQFLKRSSRPSHFPETVVLRNGDPTIQTIAWRKFFPEAKDWYRFGDTLAGRPRFEMAYFPFDPRVLQHEHRLCDTLWVSNVPLVRMFSRKDWDCFGMPRKKENKSP